MSDIAFYTAKRNFSAKKNTFQHLPFILFLLKVLFSFLEGLHLS